MAVKIQLRGDTKANWLLANPVISEREMVLETDTGKYKIGDGVNNYADLSYHGIDGKPSRITEDGFWEIYNPATDVYVKTAHKAVPADVQVVVKTNNVTTYILTFTHAGGSFDTPNLRGSNGTNGTGATVSVVTNTATEYVLKFTSVSGEVTTPNLKPQNYDDTEIRAQLSNVEAIARGRSRAQVFDTVAAMNTWLAVPANVATLQIGDNLLIKATNVPDYWWDGTAAQPLEAEKVDLTPYLKSADAEATYAKKAVATPTSNGLMSKEDKQKLDDLLLDIPIVSRAPDRGITAWTDEDGVSHPFRIGQMCRVSVSAFASRAPSWAPDDEYDFYIMTQGWFDMEGDENIDPYDYAYWSKITWGVATTSNEGLMSADDKTRLDNTLVFKNVTTATTLTGLSIANYSIKVTLSAASALSFASTPPEGWECMIDIKNTSSSDITQALPNASGWQCEDTSMTIAAGKIASISVRYVHGTYVVIAKGN